MAERRGWEERGGKDEAGRRGQERHGGKDKVGRTMWERQGGKEDGKERTGLTVDEEKKCALLHGVVCV